MANDVMLSTVDNPFNPFTQFDSWLNWDYRLGHDTCGKLARVAKCSNALSDDMNDEEIERAMDSLVESQPGFFIKLHQQTADQVIKKLASS